VVFWVVAPCNILLYTNISEEHAVYVFRAEVRRVRMLMGYVGLFGGLGQGAQEDWAVRAMGHGVQFRTIGQCRIITEVREIELHPKK
jgi:hypothetical protein